MMDARRKRVCLVVVALAVFAVPLSLRGQEPSIVIVKPVVRLVTGATEGTVEMVLQTPVNGSPNGVPKLTDVRPSADAPTVDFIDVSPLAASPAGYRSFRVQAVIRKLPAGYAVLRTVDIDWPPLKLQRPFWLTNVPAATLDWSVGDLPPKWALAGDRCHAIRIAASGTRATGITVTSTLVEGSRNRLADGVFLSLDGTTEAAAQDLELAINDTGQKVFLCFRDTVAPGDYTGTVTVSAAEKRDAAAVNMVVYATSTSARAIGALFLALGCLLAFFVRALLPTKVSRNLALLSAALLREEAGRLLTLIDNMQAPKTRSRLTELQRKLDEDSLGTLIPSATPTVFGPANDTAAFKKLLDDSSATLAKLYVVVVQGFQMAGGNAAVITTIDDLAFDSQTLDQLKAAVDAAIPRPAGAPAAVAAPLPRSRELRLKIDTSNRHLIWVWMALTFAIGFVMLILNDPGFGVPIDYLYCLVWGIGLPVVGQQLTGASAGSALGVTFPPAPPH
jgi:hypothetical protein